MTPLLSEEQGRGLLRAARLALESHLAGAGEPLDAVWKPERETGGERRDFAPGPPAGGVFVTLRLDGRLRGCIGYVRPLTDLLPATLRAALAAATSDPRFPRLTSEELPHVRLSISVLTLPERLDRPEAVTVGRDGLIVEKEGLRGLLLPQVAVEQGWSRERFLSATCRKAGLPAQSWRDCATVLHRFEAVCFQEDR